MGLVCATDEGADGGYADFRAVRGRLDGELVSGGLDGVGCAGDIGSEDLGLERGGCSMWWLCSVGVQKAESGDLGEGGGWGWLGIDVLEEVFEFSDFEIAYYNIESPPMVDFVFRQLLSLCPNCPHRLVLRLVALHNISY